MADNNLKLAEYGIAQVTNTELQDDLAKHVRQSYDDAKAHKRRTGVSDLLLKCLRSKLCENDPNDIELLQDNDVYVGIGALKQRAAESWLIDIIVNNIEKPWTLNNTPEPDLPERLKAKVIDMLIKELPSFNTFDALKDRAAELKSAVGALANKAAEATTKRMETHIDDQLTEGGWGDTFAKYVNQLTTYPTAILRGPIEVGVPTAKWVGDKLKVERGTVLKVRTVSPFDAFPSADSTSAMNGSYFVERIDYSQSDLHSLIGVPSFNAGNIRAALDKYEEGYSASDMERSQEKELQDRDSGLEPKLGLEVLIYNGKIKGRLLASKGVIVEDIQKYYECEVWVVGDLVIRAVLNPNPLGKRPLYSTSFVKIDGKFWGKGVIQLVYDVERICNAACRAIVRNMGYASGPIGEVVSDRIAEGDDPTDIRPYNIFRVGPDLTGTGAPAFKFHNVTAIGADLMAVFEKYMKLADDLSGVPAYVLGNPQVAGAGRTLGGLSMLMGNAAKGIKNVQLNIDRDIITNVVEAFYMYNMLTSKDSSIKADAKVVARGATGLLQRELAQTRTVEVLQLLTPYTQPGPDGQRIIEPNSLKYILREILKNTGLDVDKAIPDPYAEEAGGELAGTFNAPNPQLEQSNRGTSTPVPLPTQSLPPPNANPPIPTPINLPQGA
jgi:hypothetical protein